MALYLSSQKIREVSGRLAVVFVSTEPGAFQGLMMDGQMRDMTCVADADGNRYALVTCGGESLAWDRNPEHEPVPCRMVSRHQSAIVICDDKAPQGARVLCSLPARLNGYKTPGLRELRGIVEGRSIDAAADAHNHAQRLGAECGETGPDWTPTDATRFYAQRGDVFTFGATLAQAVDRLALELETKSAPARAALPCEWPLFHATRADGTGTTFSAASMEAARAYCPAAVRIVNADTGETWEALRGEDAYAAMVATGNAAFWERRALLVAECRARAELLRNKPHAMTREQWNAFNVLRARGWRACDALAYVRMSYWVALRRMAEPDMCESRAARIARKSLAAYVDNRALIPEDAPRLAWRAAYSVSRLNNPRF